VKMMSVSEQAKGLPPFMLYYILSPSTRRQATMQVEGQLSDNESIGPGVSGSPRRETAALTPEQTSNAAPLDGEDLTLLALQTNGRRRDPTGDQALMGAVHEDGNVHGLEAVDENGELVADEFIKFLQQ
jgi:hypothetical protein